MLIAGFDWDAGNRSKCRKHGVSAPEVEELFQRPVAILPDPEHSESEERFKAIGKTNGNRWIFVVFTLRTRRGEKFIRPISARYMHQREVKHYEKETAAASKRQGG